MVFFDGLDKIVTGADSKDAHIQRAGTADKLSPCEGGIRPEIVLQGMLHLQ